MKLRAKVNIDRYGIIKDQEYNILKGDPFKPTGRDIVCAQVEISPGNVEMLYQSCRFDDVLLLEHFYSIDEWRNKQINKIIE